MCYNKEIKPIVQKSHQKKKNSKPLKQQRSNTQKTYQKNRMYKTSIKHRNSLNDQARNTPRTPTKIAIKPNLDAELILAADGWSWLGEGEGEGEGEGQGTGEDTLGNTVITSFWFPTSQCWPKPQMYHFLPGVARVITSFPLVSGTVPAGAEHCWKPVPLTLRTLWTPCG